MVRDLSKAIQLLIGLTGIHTQVSPTLRWFCFLIFVNKMLMLRGYHKIMSFFGEDVKTGCKEKSKAVLSSGIQAELDIALTKASP